MRQRYSSKPEIAVPVRVSFKVDGEEELATGWVSRLSLAGVDIETLQTPAVGSRMVFRAALDPNGSEVLSYEGRVQWVAGARVGVQFTELGAKETYSILQAMRKA